MSNELFALPEIINPATKNMLTNKIRWAVQRDGSEVVKKAIIANMHEQGRALITKTALDNLGALSALEAHLIQIAPYGQERYRQVIDAYALGAASKIWRW